MSDAGANIGIEDVISSIRRLVEVDGASPLKSPVRPLDRPPSSERLLLTPALRVAEPSTPEPSANGASASEPDTRVPYQDAPGDNQTRPEMPAAPQPEIATKTADRHQPETSLAAPSRRVSETRTPGSASHAERSEDHSLEDRIAELEAAVGAQISEWEPDGSVAAEDDDTPDMSIAVLGARIASHAVLSSGGLPSGSLQEQRTQAQPLEEEDQLLDEAALRDLVAEIVREELKGALGERITRNVRRLVRREIARALTAHDLD